MAFFDSLTLSFSFLPAASLRLSEPTFDCFLLVSLANALMLSVQAALQLTVKTRTFDFRRCFFEGVTFSLSGAGELGVWLAGVWPASDGGSVPVPLPVPVPVAGRRPVGVGVGVVPGGVVTAAIVQVRDAGGLSTLPSVSVARTWKV